jgi:hypothetical protein
MASVVAPYLAWFKHPVYPQRSVLINAVDLPTAQTVATAQVAGTLWTVVSVELYGG